MRFITNIPPQIFSLSAVAVGFLLTNNATPNEQNAIGNWLMLVAQYLCTDAVYGQLLQSKHQTPGSFYEPNNINQFSSNSNSTDEETIKMLQKMVDAISQEIAELKKNL